MCCIMRRWGRERERSDIKSRREGGNEREGGRGGERGGERVSE